MCFCYKWESRAWRLTGTDSESIAYRRQLKCQAVGSGCSLWKRWVFNIIGIMGTMLFDARISPKWEMAAGRRLRGISSANLCRNVTSVILTRRNSQYQIVFQNSQKKITAFCRRLFHKYAVIKSQKTTPRLRLRAGA